MFFWGPKELLPLMFTWQAFDKINGKYLFAYNSWSNRDRLYAQHNQMVP